MDKSNSPAVWEEETIDQSEADVALSAALSQQTHSPPATVPGYQMLRCLGSGGFGAVWLAREEKTGRLAAIKFYLQRRVVDWPLLCREVEKLATLDTSRNIVALQDVGWDSDPPYYVMEYLEQGSLSEYLASGALSVAEAVRIARSILHGLVHAHGSGILHCDLKPANILLDSDYEPRLCDFGQSRLSYEQSPALGTMFYMAPEQADLSAVPDARWDVYALGAVLYQMLTGNPPHRTPENQQRIRDAETLEERLSVYRSILNESPRPGEHRKQRGVSWRLAEIIDRCLAVDPQLRYPNAQAALDALDEWEYQQARRPLIALGIVGPSLLLLAMFVVALDAMRSAVQTARTNLAERALEGDSVSVNILARSVERELIDRRLELQQIASEMELRKVVARDADKPREERTELWELLSSKKRQVDQERAKLDRERDISWFLTDAKGFQRWREPLNRDTIEHDFAYRDYYHGRGVEYDPENVPADVDIIHEPYVSSAFRSEATKQYMVAIAIPVWHPTENRVVGVLGRTTHLGQLLSEHVETIVGRKSDGASRKIALVDCRDWRLLDHPWMTTENVRDLPEEAFQQLVLAKDLTERLSAQLASQNGDSPSAPFFQECDYIDPVSRLSPEKYGGSWLAAFSPVRNLNWMTVVQERKQVALSPVDKMQDGLVESGVWALGMSSVLIGTLWYFVFRALQDRNVPLLIRSDGSSAVELPKLSSRPEEDGPSP